MPYFAVSAVTGEGIDALVRAVAEQVHDVARAGAPARSCTSASGRTPTTADRAYSVRNLGGGVYAVEGRGIERMVVMTEWENEEALAFLQKRLVKAGVEAALIRGRGPRRRRDTHIGAKLRVRHGACPATPRSPYIEEEPEDVSLQED